MSLRWCLWVRRSMGTKSFRMSSDRSDRRHPDILDQVAKEVFGEMKPSGGIPSTFEMETIAQTEADRMEYGRRRSIVRKKFGFEPPIEDNMLTWEAKDLIFQLHRDSPSEWTAERIAQSFPISEDGAKRLLKSADRENRTPVDVEKIRSHDELVEGRWRALETNRPYAQLSDFTRHQFYSGKIKYIPHINYGQYGSPAQREDQKSKPDRPMGMFTKMIEAHLSQNPFAIDTETVKESTMPTNGSVVLKKRNKRRP